MWWKMKAKESNLDRFSKTTYYGVQNWSTVRSLQRIMHISFTTQSNPIIPTPKVHQLNEEYGAKTVLKNTLKRSSKLITFPTQKTDRTEQRFLCAYLVPFVNRALIPSWCKTKGRFWPLLCNDSRCLTSLINYTHGSPKYFTNKPSGTQNRPRSHFLDFPMLMTEALCLPCMITLRYSQCKDVLSLDCIATLRIRVAM